MKFVATPGLGCAEAVFSFKTMLQMRREHNIGSRALFEDLIKTCNSAKYEVAPIALKKMGAVPKRVRWVEKSNGDFNTVLKV